MKIIDKQTSFNSGVMSPRLSARDDLKQYNNALADGLNVICSKYGPVNKRTGTVFVREVKDSSKDTYLIPFLFSADQNILIEAGDAYCRFFTFDGSGVGAIPDPTIPTNPYELSTTGMTSAQVADISYAQSGNSIYIANTGFPVKEMKRVANDNWTINALTIIDGPYADINADVVKVMTPSAVSGNGITITASGAGNTPFAATDVGRLIRISNPASGTAWGYAKIKTFTSSTVVTADVVESFSTTNASKYWRLGEWSATDGYPANITIHQQRLVCAGGTTNKKMNVWTSKTFAFDDFAPSAKDGTVAASDAINISLAAEQSTEILWLRSLKSLLIGTDLDEYRLYSSGTTLAPGDRVANRESSYGSHNTEPVIFDEVLMFIQRLQRKVRAISYDYTSDSYKGPDLTLIAEHLSLGGIKKVIRQKEPDNVVWVLKEDGSLLSLVYDNSQEVFAWTRHEIGGSGIVKDMASLPSSLCRQDVLFLIVERTINGATKKYIEYLSKNFSDNVLQSDAIFLDSALTYSGVSTSTISGLEHLEGETVTIIDSGADGGTAVVTSGAITLVSATTKAVIGLPYEAYVDTLERDIQGTQQVSIYVGKTRLYKLLLYLYRTLGVTYAHLSDVAGLYEVPVLDFGQNMDTVPALVTGRIPADLPSSFEMGNAVRVKSKAGFPFTLLGIITGVEINGA